MIVPSFVMPLGGLWEARLRFQIGNLEICNSQIPECSVLGKKHFQRTKWNLKKSQRKVQQKQSRLQKAMKRQTKSKQQPRRSKNGGLPRIYIYIYIYTYAYTHIGPCERLPNLKKVLMFQMLCFFNMFLEIVIKQNWK